MSERVLAIDPGERVGWAHGELTGQVRLVRPVITGRRIPKGTLPPIGESSMEFGTEPVFGLEVTGHGITPLKDFAVKLGEVFPDYDTVVYETWRLRAGMERRFIGNDFQPVQLIGIIRYLSWLHPNVKLVSQGPSLKKTGIKVAAAHLPEVQALLERLPKTHDDAHDGDAVMHLAAYWHSQVKGSVS